MYSMKDLTNEITTVIDSLALRIQDRATRRCGELLKEFEAKNQYDAHAKDGDGPCTIKEAGAKAGLSERQQKTAIRVANVPAEEFEAQVESDSPLPSQR
jgi:hypothetical protein